MLQCKLSDKWKQAVIIPLNEGVAGSTLITTEPSNILPTSGKLWARQLLGCLLYNHEEYLVTVFIIIKTIFIEQLHWWQIIFILVLITLIINHDNSNIISINHSYCYAFAWYLTNTCLNTLNKFFSSNIFNHIQHNQSNIYPKELTVRLSSRKNKYRVII